MSGVDALVWVMESEGRAGDRVEVHQVWGDLLMNVRSVEADATIAIGSTPGWRWNLLGVDMGPIPAFAAKVLPFALPLLAEAVAAPRADFEVPSVDLPGESDHVLVRDGQVHVADGWEGFVDLDGQRVPFSQLGRPVPGGRAIPLQPGSRVVVEVAGQVFQIRRSAPEKRAVARFAADPGLIGTFGLVGALLAAVLAAAPRVTSETITAELPESTVDVAQMVVQPPKVAKQSDEGSKAPDAEGRSGKKDARDDDRPGKKMKTDREIAESAGLLSAVGLGAPELSADLLAGVGSLIGANGSRIGTGGLGNRGPGLGGGGTADGIGGLGLHGPGPDDRTSKGWAKGEGELNLVDREVVTIGSIDKSLIDEVIKRHLAQIRYCYQRELNRNPDLGGKVVVKFTIAGDGTVSSAATKASTMGNATVEGCINGRFQRMTFPQPKGGGLAIVSYPFVFSPE